MKKGFWTCFFLFLLFFNLALSEPKSKKLRVVVIDTGVDSKIPQLRKYIPKEYRDTEAGKDFHGHGTHVFGLIAEKACDDVEIIPCKAFKDPPFIDSLEKTIECLKKAVELDADIVNYSAGGYKFEVEELKVLMQLEKKHTIVVVAAGNDGANIDQYQYFPAGYDLSNLVVVGNLAKPQFPAETSNTGTKVVWEKGVDVSSTGPGNRKLVMSGTSQATAKQTGRLVEFFCKFKSKGY